MKQLFLVSLVFVCSLSMQAQNRDATVKALNNYIAYSNSNIKALKAAEQTLESYNGLFNDYLRKDRKLGGEEYEKPKPSPFIDEDVFTLKKDDPNYLYSVATTGSAVLPVSIKTELNTTLKSLKACSDKIVLILDSMSNIFSGPLISVTKNESVLPYNLLAEGRRQLQLSKKYRDQLFASVTGYYNKNCTLPTADTDYMRSVKPLRKGMELCQSMMNDLSKNDSSRIPQFAKSLDSLHSYLDRSELILLKGIPPMGRSRHYPSGNINGSDLYLLYEEYLDLLKVFADYAKDFSDPSDKRKFPHGKCFAFHTKCREQFNSFSGILDTYNEYALLIGGGKREIESELGTLMRGWGDESHSLVVKPLLSWMKETPLFEIEWPKQ